MATAAISLSVFPADIAFDCGPHGVCGYPTHLPEQMSISLGLLMLLTRCTRTRNRPALNPALGSITSQIDIGRLSLPTRPTFLAPSSRSELRIALRNPGVVRDGPEILNPGHPGIGVDRFAVQDRICHDLRRPLQREDAGRPCRTGCSWRDRRGLRGRRHRRRRGEHRRPAPPSLSSPSSA